MAGAYLGKNRRKDALGYLLLVKWYWRTHAWTRCRPFPRRLDT